MYSSHHVQLVNHTATLFNSLLEKEVAAVVSMNGLHPYPTLPHIEVQESMGLVESAHSQTYGGLVEADLPNTDSPDPSTRMLEDVEEQMAEMDEGRLVQSLNVDEQMLHVLLATGNGLTSSVAHLQLQKRKSHADAQSKQFNALRAHIGHDNQPSDDTPSKPKRRRTAAPPSPSTQAEMGLSTSSPPAFGGVDLEDSESPPLDLELMQVSIL